MTRAASWDAQALHRKLAVFRGSDKTYPLRTGSLRVSAGVDWLIANADAQQLVSAISDQQYFRSVRKHWLQVWELRPAKPGGRFVGVLIGHDPDGERIAVHGFPHLRFPLPEFTLWVENLHIILPSEH